MTKSKGLSIGAAMKSRMQGDAVQEAQPVAVPVAVQAAPVGDELESFNTRLPRSLQRRLKVYTASQGIKIQDVVSAALDAYLSEQERKL